MKLITVVDGGGINGIYPATTVSELQRRGYLLTSDAYVGTSIGGVFSLFLGMGRPASVFLDLIRNEGKTIFRLPLRSLVDPLAIWRTKYDAENLESAMRYHFGEVNMAKCVTPTMVTSGQISNMKHLKVSSWEWPDFPIWKAAVATASAPYYFPPTEDGFFDGGTWANNPSLVGLLVGHKLWPGEPFKILSLGCGESPQYVLPREARKYGLARLAPILPRMLMSVGMEFSTEVAQVVLGKRYLRINPNLEAVPGDMDRVDDTHLRDMRALAIRHAYEQAPRIIEFLESDE